MVEPAAPKTAEEELLRMTADVVAAYVSNNTLPTAQLAEVINAVYEFPQITRRPAGGISVRAA